MPVPIIPLAQMVKQKQPHREIIRLRPITPTKAQKQSLADINMRVVRAWEDAEADIVAAYSRAKAVQDAISDDVSWLEAAIDAVAQYVASQMVIIEQLTLGWANGLNAWHLLQFTGRVDAATGLNIANMAPLATDAATQAVNETTAWNVSLVRDISDQARGRIATATLNGLRNGLPVDQVAAEISKATGMARSRAIRVAIDQTNKLASALDLVRLTEAGFTQFVWVHRSIENPRLWHLARDGKVFRLSDPDLRGDMPGDLPFCRCKRAGLMRL